MKGGQVEQFEIGQRVKFSTFLSVEKGTLTSIGKIGKLHKSGKNGVAEIYPEQPIPEHFIGHQRIEKSTKKVSRKLQHVARA